MLKFLVVDVNEVGQGDDCVVEDVDNMDAGIETATKFADEVMDEDSDGLNTVSVGIYKLVKTVTVQRTRNVTVKSHK